MHARLVYEHNSRPAWTICDVLLHETEDTAKIVAVFTQLDAHRGVSITNSVESACAAFCEDRNLYRDQCVFIERYEHSPADLDMIILDDQGHNPHWKHLAKDQAAGILAVLPSPKGGKDECDQKRAGRNPDPGNRW